MVDRTLLLVDGSSYLYRAYHALPDLRGPGGFPTGAIRGVVSMMKLLRDQYPAGHGACVFDDKGKTFRDDWYPEYKAHRTAMPDDLALQIEPIIEAVKLLGWPVLIVPGIEADDAIGTISCMAAKGGFKVVISTGDKDLAQLVGDNVTLINTMSNETLDSAGVAAKFGVPPERIVDYLALIGDPVDNVPGVDKVGPKTAAKWLAEHGSLEGVIAAAPQIKGVVGENLRKALDWLPQGRRLVTVVTDCDLSGHVLGWPEFDALALRERDTEALLAFYDRYGFGAMRRELEAAAAKSAGSAAAAASPAAAAADVVAVVPSETNAKHY
ncbi:MAG: 5'-3' exonuclease, partial [Caldimonas sp.]